MPKKAIITQISPIPHGFSWSGIIVIILLALILWGVSHEVKRTAPILTYDSEQINELNKNLEDLKVVDIHYKFPGSIVGKL